MTVTPASSTALPHYDLLIIGSGIAGLAAGRIAQQAGQSVMLIDKGRRVGGRVSTHRADGFLFNHGAQFTTRSTPFRTSRPSWLLCKSWISITSKFSVMTAFI